MTELNRLIAASRAKLEAKAGRGAGATRCDGFGRARAAHEAPGFHRVKVPAKVTPLIFWEDQPGAEIGSPGARFT